MGGMTTLQVQLPETTFAFLAEQAQAHGLGSAAEYLAALAADAEANREWVEEELEKGLTSGPSRPMQRQDWDELKRRVQQRQDTPREK